MTLNYISSQNRVNTFQQKVCCRPGYSSRTVSFCIVTWGSRVSLVLFPPSPHSSPTNPLDKRVDRSKRSITAAVTFCGLKVTSVSSAYSPLSTQILVIWTTAVTYFAHSLQFEQDLKGMTPLISMQCQPKLAPEPLCAHFLGKGREKKQNIYYKVRNIFIILGISFAFA